MAAPATQGTPAAAPTPVWDLPVRLGHWLLVGLLAFSWFSGETRRIELHRWSGYAVLAVLVFRIYWGFVGSSTARFAGFVKGPRETLRYARRVFSRDLPTKAGHNPLGALSVLALLAVLVAQAVTGLFAVDVDGLESGPLSDRVSFELGRTFANWHALSFRTLQALVAVHLSAIAFYALVKGANLVGPMVSGRAPRGAMAPVGPARALLGLALAAATAWFIARGMRF
jgi:cytochrome b